MVVVVSILAVLMLILTPSLMQYTERSRAQKDSGSMDELTNAIQLALADSDVYDEVVRFSTNGNVSCYVDTNSEANYERITTKQENDPDNNQYTFANTSRTADETPYFAAGNMRGVTITFAPFKGSNVTEFDLKQGVVNQFVQINGNQRFGAMKNLYAYTKSSIGEAIKASSQTYRNSEFTVFIGIGTTGGNDESAQNSVKVYGQWSGTNLPSSEVKYQIVSDRTIGVFENPKLEINDSKWNEINGNKLTIKPGDLNGGGTFNPNTTTGNQTDIIIPEQILPDDFESMRISKDKTAKHVDGNTYEITLEVGGNEERVDSDIVFLMGSGPAGDISYIKSLIKKMIAKQNGSVKLGIVTFADTTEKEIVMPLTRMVECDETNTDPEDMDVVIENALEKAINDSVAAGVNLDSALVTAREMLESDKSVSNKNKHLIAITSGMTYFYDNENGNACTIVNTDSKGNPCWGNKTWIALRTGIGNTDSGYLIPWEMDWTKYWSYIEEWVEADRDKYEFELINQTYSQFYNNNKTEDRSIRFGFQITNSHDKVKAELVKVPYFTKKTNPTSIPEDSTEAQLKNFANAAHALNYERSMYESYETWNEMKNMGYTCHMILYCKDQWKATTQIARGFVDMMNDGRTPMYGDENFFKVIESDIMASVSSGSTVTDFMGFDSDVAMGYDFDFVNDVNTLKLKLNDVPYITKQISATTYEFINPNTNNATFTLNYIKGDGGAGEHFVWTFGEDVTDNKSVCLTYNIKLANKKENVGLYVAYTNQWAELVPKDSDGNVGKPERFPIPVVSYQNN